jgi:hypothetical protein
MHEVVEMSSITLRICLNGKNKYFQLGPIITIFSLTLIFTLCFFYISRITALTKFVCTHVSNVSK